MLILGLDFETTHFDQDLLRVTELGAALWDTELSQPVEIYSVLINDDFEEDITEEITQLTGITTQMLKDHGECSYVAVNELSKLYAKASYVCAHNGNEFDRPVLERWVKRQEQEFNDDLHWIDTTKDLPLDSYCRYTNMLYLSAFHGFINPFAHRAVSDVLSMLRILNQYDINRVIEISKSEEKIFLCLVDYHDRALAKQAGFRWNAETRFWEYKIKGALLDQEAYEAGTLWDVPYKEAVKNQLGEYSYGKMKK